MKFRIFLCSWFRVAFTGNLWIAERVEFAFTVILGAVAYIWFSGEHLVIILMTGIPAAVLVGTIIAGLPQAPYWLYREVEIERDSIKEGKPKIIIAIESESRMKRLRITNIGAAASVRAWRRIIEHKVSTPWPIQWRSTESDEIDMNRGDSYFLNVASETVGTDGSNDVQFYTADQPYRRSTGIANLRSSMVTRDFFLNQLPKEVARNNRLTFEVSITTDPSMEVQPYRTTWYLNRENGNTLELHAA